MWLRKLSVLVLYYFGFASGFNLTENFQELIFPDRLINTLQNNRKISNGCKLQLFQYGNALKKPKFWAFLMLDAGTKIPSGIFSGNAVDLGNFDQCLNIEEVVSKKSTIYGKYCLAQIPLVSAFAGESNLHNPVFTFNTRPETRMTTLEGAVFAAFATCLPAACSTTDIEEIYSPIKVKFDDLLCQSKLTLPELTGGDIATISFLSVILCIMLASTVYDSIIFYLEKKPAHSLLTAFSILTNGRKLIATSNSSSQISCLHGIRVISMMWIILSHRYSFTGMLPKMNAFSLIQWANDKKSMFIIGATVSVDTFFVLGGLLVSYSFMSAMAKGLKFNILVFYIHRYLRLTPLFAVIILIYVTILKHLGSGPLWTYSTMMLNFGCEEYWWSALLHVQNYVNQLNLCVAQSWYLSVDTQLYILSPIILILLKRLPSVGILTTIVFTVLSMVASFLVGWIYELRGLTLANENEYFNLYYYLATHTRAAPWLMGLILGYYIHEIKQKHKNVPMHKLLATLLWAISLAILGACVFTGHNFLTSPYDRLANSFYIALVRPAWALGVCWVIFACVIGYGGPVNWFLSLPVFQIVSRLTYSMYLIHFGMEMIISGQMRSATVFSNLNMFYAFWGDFAFSLATAVIFTLAFESPIIVIEKMVFGSEEKKKTQEV